MTIEKEAVDKGDTEMKVSVIVPVYNLEVFVGPCLESLVTQRTAFPFEVIVANDCSTDDSLRVIEHYQRTYPDVIRIINQTRNQGLAANMKALLAACQGEFIAYIDGDDLALPGKLQAQVDFLEQHPSCNMVYHESEVFDSQTDETLSHYVRDYYNRQYIPEFADITHLVKYGSFFQAGSIMFRAHDQLVATVDTQCKIILDHPFQVLNAGFLGGQIGMVDKVLGRYRIHANSFGAKTLSDYSRREQVLADQLCAIRNASQFDVGEEVIRQGESHYYMATAMYFLKLGVFDLFEKYILLSAQTDWRFDDRHAFLVDNKADVEKCQRVFSR